MTRLFDAETAPPHPTAVAATARNPKRLNNAFHLRLRKGRKKSSAAKVPPPPRRRNRRSIGLRSAALDAAVVLMVSVDVTGPVPEMGAGWAAEQVGASIAPDGWEVMAQVSATLPINPPLGVTVMVEVALAPGDAILIGAALIVKAGATIALLTAIAMLVVLTTLPELPVTVAVYDPGLVPACVLMVSVDDTGAAPEIDAGWVAKQTGAWIAPDGVEVTAHVSATLPVKPPLGVIVIVEVVDPPWGMPAAGEALNENAPVTDEGWIR